MATAKLEFELKTKLCKKCGICSALCPRGVLAAGENGAPIVVNPKACIFCKLCEMRCPDFAIRVWRCEE